jgi:uncharacterized membrane protein
VYDAHIEEAASDLAQLKNLRQQIKQQHEQETKAQISYIEHLRRKVISRAQRGGDLTTYSRVLDALYCRNMCKVLASSSATLSTSSSSLKVVIFILLLIVITNNIKS